MKFINLDETFDPFGKGIEIDTFTFSGGEPHIRILGQLNPDDAVTITARPRNFEDFGMILLTADAVSRMGVTKMELLLPYFPGARQDRVMVIGEPLSVKIYVEMINSCNFSKVTIYDPHSDVVTALLNNVNIVSNHKYVENIVSKLKEDYVLVSPDGGALKKIFKLSQFLGGIEVIEASKRRDVKTGKLSSFHVYSEELNGRTCVVVDDICDGGGTFLGLAHALKHKNAGKLILVASHGIFNRGFEHLIPLYNEIHCTNSFRSIKHKSVVQTHLNEEYL